MDFTKIGRTTDKDILRAAQLIVDNFEVFTQIDILEHYDFDGMAKTTVSFTFLTQRDRE